MHTQSMVRLCFTFLLGVALYTSQSSGNPLNKQGLYDLEANDHLEKRATNINLATVWAGITGGNKVGVGNAVGWTLDPTKAAAFTTSEFYGCTVVIIVDGHGVIIGHFAEVGTPACTSMTNQNSINTQVIPKLDDAWNFVDGSSDSRAYILINVVEGTTCIGYKSIVQNLLDNDVLSQNIHPILYVGSSGTGEFPGVKGKAVVTWTPNAAGNGALLDVYIQDNSPILEQAYDSNGNPVGAPACAGNNKHKRQGACALPGAAADNPSTTSSATTGPTTTAPATTPAPTCYQQNEDPDQGILQQGCICSQGTITKTLPLLATDVDPSSSCAYTAIATQSTIAITTDFGPAVTNSMLCSVCSPLQDNVATCTSLPNCLPQTPTATIQIGSSPVPVGTLTSTSLSSAISSAVSSLCPPVTQTTTSTTCDETTKIVIPNIAYIEEDSLATDGELLVQIDSSGYNDTALLGPLAGMAGMSISSSAAGNNCYTADYMAEDYKAKRWYSSALDTGLSLAPFYKRDRPYPVPEKIELCNCGDFASPQIYGQWWREAPKPGPGNYISVTVTFSTGAEGNLFCEFIEDLEEAIEATFTPELLAEEEFIDQEINIGCEDAMSYIGG